MELIDQINKAVKEKYGTWGKFEKQHPNLPTRKGKRKIETYLLRLNKWLNSLGLKLKIVKK